MQITKQATISIALTFAAILFATIGSFWPALSGPFLLDDFNNLEPLSAAGGVTDWATFQQFVFGGRAGPTGRPLALLSFLINDYTWPSDPWGFKYTNLLIHVLNGCLVFIFSSQIAGLLHSSKKAAYLSALAACALWLLHPLLFSTVMLVIQRMTELMMTFSLLGLIAYLAGRKRLSTHPSSAYIQMSISIVVFGALATLSKENGALLPLYVLIIEIAFKKQLTPHRLFLPWAGVFLYAPLVIMAGYFILTWSTIIESYTIRSFTLSERLLTESRILWDYLIHIITPQVAGSGPFHDDYLISRGLTDPIWTLLSLLAWIVLIGVSLIYRKQQPLLFFAVAWFLAGHLMESSFIPLELYFEHRNYLPALGPILAFAIALSSYTGKWHRLIQKTPYPIAALFLFINFQNATVWGDEVRIAKIWPAEHPTSFRAQQLAAGYWLKYNDFDLAQKNIAQAIKYNPNQFMLRLQLIQIQCANNSVDAQALSELIKRASIDSFSDGVFETISVLIGFVKSKRCDGLNYEPLLTVLDKLLKNPRYPGYLKRDMGILKSGIYSNIGDLSATIEALDEAAIYDPQSADIPLMQAGYLASAGLYADALTYTQQAKERDAMRRIGIPSKLDGIKQFENILREKLKQEAKALDSSPTSP